MHCVRLVVAVGLVVYNSEHSYISMINRASHCYLFQGFTWGVHLTTLASISPPPPWEMWLYKGCKLCYPTHSPNLQLSTLTPSLNTQISPTTHLLIFLRLLLLVSGHRLLLRLFYSSCRCLWSLELLCRLYTNHKIKSHLVHVLVIHSTMGR